MSTFTAEDQARSRESFRTRRDRAFWALVEIEGDCWIWQGSLQTQNKWKTEPYGKLSRNGREIYAHRHAYALVNGPIPDDREVRHSCDRPRCINPTHLSLGTHAENMADMAMRGRAGGRRLTSAQASELRGLYRAGGWSQQQLADRYRVHQATVWAIVNGRRYVEGAA